jgi:hypothetical protein
MRWSPARRRGIVRRAEHRRSLRIRYGVVYIHSYEL